MARGITRTRVPEDWFVGLASLVEMKKEDTSFFTNLLREGEKNGLPEDYPVSDQYVEAKLTRMPDGFRYDEEGRIFEGDKEISPEEFERRLNLPNDDEDSIPNMLGTNIRVILGKYGDDYHDRKPFNIPGATGGGTGKRRVKEVRPVDLTNLAARLGLDISV